MAMVYVTIKIMPESPDINLATIQEKAKDSITEFGGNVAKVEEEPVAFGLKSINITFTMDESKGATDPLEEGLEKIENVQSVQVTDVRRGIG